MLVEDDNHDNHTHLHRHDPPIQMIWDFFFFFSFQVGFPVKLIISNGAGVALVGSGQQGGSRGQRSPGSSGLAVCSGLIWD